MDKAFPWQPSASTTRSETACVNFANDLLLYAAGFRQGAEILLGHVRSTTHDQDFLVYPIVYNLRHAVELLLKQVIRGARHLIDERDDFPDGHKLNILWSTCKPILRRIWSDDPAYTTIEGTIKKLCVLDPEGEAFRYPVTSKKTGRVPTLDTDLRFLDLGTLVEDVIVVIDLLAGADTGIDVYLDAKHDMLEERREIEAEMRAEYEAEMRAEYEAEMRDAR